MTTGKTQIQDVTTDAPLHDESVIAVRDNFLNASDDEVSDDDGCLSRSMTIKAYNKLMKGVTPETKDSIDKEPFMKMSKSTTLINAARPERVLRSSVREQTSVNSPICHRVTILT